jgi:hypothetical protein
VTNCASSVMKHSEHNVASALLVWGGTNLAVGMLPPMHMARVGRGCEAYRRNGPVQTYCRNGTWLVDASRNSYVLIPREAPAVNTSASKQARLPE